MARNARQIKLLELIAENEIETRQMEKLRKRRNRDIISF